MLGLLVLAALATLAAYLSLFPRKPRLFYQHTRLNLDIVREVRELNSHFVPTPLLSHQLCQALVANELRFCRDVRYEREIVTLPDGECVALDWCEQRDGGERPIAVIFHGIAGGSHEVNVRILAGALREAGIRAVVFNRRGCAQGLALRHARPYQYGNTADLEFVLDHIHARFPRSPLAGIGLSAGSNPLVRYLGEKQHASKLVCGVSVANAFDLDHCSRLLARRPFYDRLMCASLRRALFEKHFDVFRRRKELDVARIRAAKSVREFDEHFTCKIYGYRNVTEYHAINSSYAFLHKVRRPLLILNALDDPIVDRALIPYEQAQRNPAIIIATTKRGGHLGWLSGLFPFTGPSWMERLCVSYVSALTGRLHADLVRATMERWSRSPPAAPAAYAPLPIALYTHHLSPPSRPHLYAAAAAGDSTALASSPESFMLDSEASQQPPPPPPPPLAAISLRELDAAAAPTQPRRARKRRGSDSTRPLRARPRRRVGPAPLARSPPARAGTPRASKRPRAAPLQ